MSLSQPSRGATGPRERLARQVNHLQLLVGNHGSNIRKDVNGSVLDTSTDIAAPAVGVSFDVVMSAVPHADASDGVSFASKKEVTIRMLLILLECV